MHPRRYAILGTGALGAYYGARLAHAGCDVHFLLRSDYGHVTKHGLTVESTEGDFSLPALGGLRLGKRELETEAFVDFLELDRIPRPIGVAGFQFPSYLLKRAVRGKVVLLIKLDETGEVLDVQLESSTLPAFDRFVVNEVGAWRFTPPTQDGRPVKARARLPIPIQIR